MRPLDQVRSEHARLVPHIASLVNTADAVELPGPSAFELIDDAWRFLDGHLLAHARAEEQVLYPALTRALGGTTEAVRLLVADHVVIARLVDELGALRHRIAGQAVVDEHARRELRRVLLGLHAVIEAHFAKEEEVVLPTLEARLAPRDIEKLLGALGHHEVAS